MQYVGEFDAFAFGKVFDGKHEILGGETVLFKNGRIDVDAVADEPVIAVDVPIGVCQKQVADDGRQFIVRNIFGFVACREYQQCREQAEQPSHLLMEWFGV